MPFGGRNSIFRKPLGTGRNSVNGRIRQVSEDLNDVARELEKTLSSQLESVNREFNEALDDVSRPFSRLENGLSIELDWGIERINDAANAAKDQVESEAAKLRKKMDATAGKIEKDLRRKYDRRKVGPFGVPNPAAGLFESAKKNLDRELTKAKASLDRELTKAKEDIDREATKFREDFERELNVAGQEVGAAVEAAKTFVEKELASMNETLSEAAQLASEGKLIDAVWLTATDPLDSTSENFAATAASSKWLNQVAAIAATAYGGPAGAAAYAAWLTYETTGDLEAALRAGVVTAIAAYGSQISTTSTPAGLPTTFTEQVKRTVTKASINAAAVAAGGGSARDIEEAFMSEATELKSVAQSAIEGFVAEEFADYMPDEPEVSFEKLDNPSLIETAKHLQKEITKFEEEWDRTVLAAERRMNLVENTVQQAVDQSSR